MERIVAVKKLEKLLGKSMGYRIDPRAPAPEERQIAQAQLREAVVQKKALEEKKRARLEAVLAADTEYQTLKEEYGAVRDRVDRLRSQALHYKIQVGVSNSMFFHIKAEGDSWEEVIEKLTKEKQVA